MYNDGKWHLVKASRDRSAGLLYIDENKVGARTATDGKSINISDKMYFGGFPGKHSFPDVTNVHFDGCIDNVEIWGTLIDLSNNKKVVGATPGCHDKVFSLLVYLLVISLKIPSNFVNIFFSISHWYHLINLVIYVSQMQRLQMISRRL